MSCATVRVLQVGLAFGETFGRIAKQLRRWQQLAARRRHQFEFSFRAARVGSRTRTEAPPQAKRKRSLLLGLIYECASRPLIMRRVKSARCVCKLCSPSLPQLAAATSCFGRKPSGACACRRRSRRISRLPSANRQRQTSDQLRAGHLSAGRATRPPCSPEFAAPVRPASQFD